jgi:hypothetical protein
MSTESLGLSQQMLEYIVIFGVLAVVIGTVFVMFWKQIVFGIMAILCIAVMANHKPQEVPTPPKQIENPVEIIPQIVPEAKPEVKPEAKPEVKPEQKAEVQEEVDDKVYFMEDCLYLTDYSEKKCEDIWHKRERPEVTQDPSMEEVMHKYSKRSLKKRI